MGKFKGFNFHLFGGQDQVLGSFEELKIQSQFVNGNGDPGTDNDPKLYQDPAYGLFKVGESYRGFAYWSRLLLDRVAGWSIKEAYDVNGFDGDDLAENCGACWATHTKATPGMHHWCSAKDTATDAPAPPVAAPAPPVAAPAPDDEVGYGVGKGSMLNKKGDSQQLSGKVKAGDAAKEDVKDLRGKFHVPKEYSFLAKKCAKCVSAYFRWDPQFRLVAKFLKDSGLSKEFFGGAQVYGHFQRNAMGSKKVFDKAFQEAAFEGAEAATELTRSLTKEESSGAERGALNLYGPCIATTEYGGNDYNNHWGLVFTAGYKYGLHMDAKVKLLKGNDIDMLAGVATRVMCASKDVKLEEKNQIEGKCQVYSSGSPI